MASVAPETPLPAISAHIEYNATRRRIEHAWLVETVDARLMRPVLR